MGCCDSKRKKMPEESAQDSLEKDSPLSHTITLDPVSITIKELHLTKRAALISNCSSVIVSFKQREETRYSSSLPIRNLHYSGQGPKVELSSSSSHLEIFLLSEFKGRTTEIGYCTVDLDSLSNHDITLSSASFLYRCHKTGTLMCEVSKKPELNFLTVENLFTINKQLSYFPPKPYPQEPYVDKTPNFLSRNSSQYQSNVSEMSNALTIVKIGKPSFDQLLEYIFSDNPAVIYHSCEKLRFFLTQSVYSKQVSLLQVSRFQKLLNIHIEDEMICEQVLWCLYRMAENSSMSDEQMPATIIKVWRCLFSVPCCILCLELMIKHAQNDPRSFIKIVKDGPIFELILDTLYMHSSAQVITQCFILVHNLFAVQHCFSEQLFENLNEYLEKNTLNSEGVGFILKILGVFQPSEKLAQAVNFKALTSVLELYGQESNKAKSLCVIVCELILTDNKTENPEQLATGIDILVKIMREHVNSVNVVESIAVVFTKLIRKIGSPPSVLCEELTIQELCDVVADTQNSSSCLSSMLELLYFINESKNIVETTEKFKYTLSILLKIYPVSSTGSNFGYDKYVHKIRFYIEKLIHS